MISIHALLAESDAFDVLAVSALLISIHALLAESDGKCAVRSAMSKGFLSTLSLRRATCFAGAASAPDKFLSTLSLRRATEYWVGGYGTANNFYPRSPCGERPSIDDFEPSTTHFYPRSPCGERPTNRRPIFFGQTISIHALLAESDGTSSRR